MRRVQIPNFSWLIGMSEYRQTYYATAQCETALGNRITAFEWRIKFDDQTRQSANAAWVADECAPYHRAAGNKSGGRINNEVNIRRSHWVNWEICHYRNRREGDHHGWRASNLADRRESHLPSGGESY